MKTPFVWLGSKRAQKRGVGPKGASLDIAARAGLPVAKGAILLHEFYRLLLDETLIHWQNGRLFANNPQEVYDALYTAVRFPRINKPVTVRPAFWPPLENATKINNIQFTHPTQLTDTLCTIWAEGDRNNPNLRRDVLIQEAMAVQCCGIACADSSNQDDLVRYAWVNGDTAVYAPHHLAEAMQIPHLQRWQASRPDLPPFAQRLQKLLRGIRRTFGEQTRQINWIDDGHICWIDEILT